MSLINKVKSKRSDGVSLNNMIVLSFLLHALVLSILFFSPSLPSPKWTFGPTYTVDLVSPPTSVIENGPAPQVPWDSIGMNSRDDSVVMKKSVEAFKPIPIKRIRTHKREVKKETGRVDKAIKRLKQKVASSPTPPSSAAGSRGARPVAGAGGGRFEMNTKMRVYYSILWAKIKEQWALPEGILPGDNLEAVIAVTILKDGTVTNLNFESRSGSRYFDESAEKAIKKASPFPSLPEWLKEKSIDVGIRFRSSELR